MQPRIMYIEDKTHSLSGPARIGRVTFSKSGASLYYGGRTLRSLKGRGFKSNYCDVDTGEEFWISGPRKDGTDRLYGERKPIEIDEDVREEYWLTIRRLPAEKSRKRACPPPPSTATTRTTPGLPSVGARTGGVPMGSRVGEAGMLAVDGAEAVARLRELRG